MTRSEDTMPWPTLRDLIAPGPVERGLYFMDAAPDVASRVQDRLVDLLWWDSVAAPGTMPACLPARQAPRMAFTREGKASVRSHRRYSRIGSMFWIDTGRSFNMATLMGQARLRGMDSGRVARAVHLQHPVGALPYLEALERIPNAALCALGDSEPSSGPTAFSRGAEGGDVRPSNSIWWTPLVIISDLMGPLCDPRLPAEDRSRISVHVLERLAHLRERAVVLAFVAPNAGDRLMASEFLRMGTRVVNDRPLVVREPQMVPAGASTEAWH
jgi:hypothetical protein